MKRFPIITASVALAALIIAAFQPLADLLIYDRQAILSGEVWRLFTGHWVHLSPRHIALDLAAFCVVGAITENRARRPFALCCLIAPWVMNAAVLLLDPEMSRCAGLSGLTYCAATCLTLAGWNDPAPRSWLSRLGLPLLTAKILSQLAHRAPFEEINSSVCIISGLTHLAGALTAAGVWLLDRSCLHWPPLTSKLYRQKDCAYGFS